MPTELALLPFIESKESCGFQLKYLRCGILPPENILN